MEMDNQYWWGISNKAWLKLACERIGGVVIGKLGNHAVLL